MNVNKCMVKDTPLHTILYAFLAVSLGAFLFLLENIVLQNSRQSLVTQECGKLIMPGSMSLESPGLPCCLLPSLCFAAMGDLEALLAVLLT